MTTRIQIDMRPGPSQLLPSSFIDHASTTPLHRQIFQAYRDAIVEGRLHAGDRLHSSRQLAALLGISRIPVVGAYDQLLAEGYCESRVGAGTFVVGRLPVASGAAPSPLAAGEPGAPGGPRDISQGPVARLQPSPPWLVHPGAFALGEIAVDHFPFASWARLVARRSRDTDLAQVRYGGGMGFLPFREAIADYLRRERGVRCGAEQIVVVSGSQQAIDLAARVLIDPGNAVWVEEPGYWGARNAMAAAGARLVPVPVDDEGLDVETGIARAPEARAVYLTPSHQFPLGAMMSATRRLRLLDWARRTGAWIIEDDYNSEYRYQSQPITALQGLDRDARVVYVGTLSKVLFPALRIGYLALPPDLVARFLATRVAMDICPPTALQAAFADFIAAGHFARHLRRTRELYAEKRLAMGSAIREAFGDRLRIQGDRAGMHLTVIYEGFADDRELAQRAADRGLWTLPLSYCHLGPPQHRGLVLGYGGVPLAEIPAAVARLREVFDSFDGKAGS